MVKPENHRIHLSPSIQYSAFSTPPNRSPSSSPRLPSSPRFESVFSSSPLLNSTTPIGSPLLAAFPTVLKRARHSRTKVASLIVLIFTVCGIVGVAFRTPRTKTENRVYDDDASGVLAKLEWTSQREKGIYKLDPHVLEINQEIKSFELASNEIEESITGKEGEVVQDFNRGGEINSSAESILVNALPFPLRVPLGGAEEKFLGYLPHSGFHNQRIELQNALLLATFMNRTLLVPPIWIGWPTPTLNYDELQAEWNQQILMNPLAFNLSSSSADPASPLYLAANYSSSFGLPGLVQPIYDPVAAAAAKLQHFLNVQRRFPGLVIRPDGYPVTTLTAAECKSYSMECRHTFKDDFLSFDFLINLEKLKGTVKMVDRIDLRERAVEGLLGVTAEDVFIMQDTQRYDFQFVDHLLSNGALARQANPSSRFKHQVSIPTLSALPHRVILIGSLFGSGKIVASRAGIDSRLKSKIGRAMAFSNPYLMEPARAIKSRLGNYYGVHARIGDGKFAVNAVENMEVTFKELLGKIGYLKGEIEPIWQATRSIPADIQRHRHKRSIKTESSDSWSHLDDDTPEEEEQEEIPLLQKRAPIPLSPSPLLDLTCRSVLHTDPHLLALNTPIYLATDSRSPTTDPALQPFFSAFPCTFILSDFEAAGEYNGGIVEDSVATLNRLVNEASGLPLGRLMLPFLEASIAAMGIETVGTAGSTFSGFASGFLHNAYRESP